MVLSTNPLRVALAESRLRTVAALAIAVLAVTFLRPDAIGGPLGGVVVPWPLLSCVVPLALSSAWHAPMSALERASARGPLLPALARVGAIAAFIVAVTLIVAIAAPADGSPITGHGLVAWRNAALISGLALTGAAVLPATSAWIPATAYVLACLAAGVPDGAEPYAWTLVLQPAHDTLALVIALAALTLGTASGLWSLRRPHLGPHAYT